MLPNEHTSTSDVMARSHASRETTASDFDLENDALSSTRQLDNGYRHFLPKQRTKRYDAPVEQEDPDFAIDTSALQKAFPEFSDASSSEEEDEFSVEIGRGGRRVSQRLDDSRDSVMTIDDSRYSASPAVRERSTNPPPRAALRQIPNRAVSGSDSLRKGAQIRRASLALKEHKLAQEPKNKGGNQRRTLSDMHAKVSETYDGSYISDERPAKVTATSRNTRFGTANEQAARITDAVNKAAGKAYLKHSSGVTDPAGSRRHLEGNPPTDTHQSFALPDIPNLSDLVSGIYEDGTPKVRSRATRFASPPNTRTPHRPEHLPLDAIPVPDDEKAIFVALKLLQEKVSTLQLDKSDMEHRLEEIEEENLILRDENSRRQKQEKRRLSMYGGDEEMNEGGVGKLTIQKNRLEAANLALQNRLDISARKASTHETTVKHLTQERDSARTQLGVAYLTLQELKAENEILAQENDEMRMQLESIGELPEPKDDKLRGNDPTKSKHRDASSKSAPEATQTHRSRVRQGTENLDGNGSTQQSVTGTYQGAPRNSLTTNRDPSQQVRSQTLKDRTAKRQRDEAYDQLFSLDLSHFPSQQSTNKRGNRTEKKLPNTSRQRTKKAIVEYVDDSELSDADIATGTRGLYNHTGPANDLTFLSFIDANEIAQLRKTLEEERAARKNRVNRDATEQTRTNTIGTKPPAPLKSSLKNSSSKVTRPSTVELPDFDVTRKSVSNTRDVSHNVTNNSASATGRRRRLSKMEEMTSAFILPDITMHSTLAKGGEPPQLSAAAQRVLNDVAQHDGKNCSVCKQVMNGNSTHDHSHGGAQDSIRVTKPVPVSDRMPEPSTYNEEPTLRPSQPPALALATVLKSLEDELAHLKMQLALHQAALNKHDASLGKKPRKSILRKIERLLREIDTKSDQIYALYDVLEGQKEDGHEMTEEEVDVTLQSIGLGRFTRKDANLTERLGQDNTKGKGVVNGDDDSESATDDDELPWEGIESTGELTGRSFSKKGVKA
ncbi:hypothetical protein FQN51_001682 [Onygenales sp. PD_10]|nr:hypothetical protein FQN51_001682 [Onygenales sp. PD_10]